MERIEYLAQSLLEVKGVEGLFVTDRAAETIGSLLPGYYEGVDLNQLRRRLQTFLGTIQESIGEFSEYVLNFGDRRLQIFHGPLCCLGVVADASANEKGVQIASRLFLKQLEPDDMGSLVEQAQDTAPSAKEPAPVAENKRAKPPEKPKSLPPLGRAAPEAKAEENATKENKKKKKDKKGKNDRFKGIWG